METQRQVVLASINADRDRERLRVGLVSLFIVVAAILAVFAPANNRVTADIISGVLFVLALGVAGYKTFKIKLPNFEVSSGNEVEEELEVICDRCGFRQSTLSNDDKSLTSSGD